MKKLSETNSFIIAILRFLACIGVFIIHYNQRIKLPACLSDIAVYGQDGLWIFFILSGFLITYSYNMKYERLGFVFPGGVLRFYIDRFFRIVPLAYIWLLVIYIVSVYILKNMPSHSFEWIRSIMFLNMLWPSSDYSTWNALYIWGSLSNFVIFYMLFPLIYRYGKGIWKSSLFLMASMSIRYVSSYYAGRIFLNIAGGTADVLEQQWFGAVLFYFALGINLYWVLLDGRITLSIPVYIVLYFITWRYEFMSCFRIGFFLAVIIVVLLNLNIEISKRKWIYSIERYTFPFYICHMLIFTCIEKMGIVYGWKLRTRAVLMILIPVLVSVLLYHLICIPSIKIGKLVEKRIKLFHIW